MARYFRLPFGVAGDKDEIPDPTESDGTVSYNQGYGPNYSLDPATEPDALSVERLMFNQLAFDITSTLQLYYQTGVPPFITSLDNNGTAFSYQRGSRVIFNDRIYESTTDGNTNTPAESGWQLVDVQGNDARYTRRSLNLSDLSNAETARDNLELGSIATLDTGTAGGNIRTNTQNDGRFYQQDDADNTFLQRDNNLDDVTNAATARTNLQLGSVATADAGTAGAEIRTNTQNENNFYPRTLADTTFLQVSNNLSDLSDTVAARTNLELGTAAQADTGTAGGNVPTITQADSRYYTQTAADAEFYSRTLADSTFLQVSNNLSDIDNPSTARTNLNLGTAATVNTGSAAGEISLNSAFGTAARVDTGTESGNVPTTSQADSRYLRVSRNLDDLSNVANARTNLELETGATTPVGQDQDEISLISNSGFGGYTLIDQDDGTQEFTSPDDINRNGMFYFSNPDNDLAFPASGDWFVFSMVSGSSSGNNDDGVKSQIAVGAGTKATENLFIRGQNSDDNNWSNWESVIAILPVLLNWGFGQFFSNFMNGNFFPGMY